MILTGPAIQLAVRKGDVVINPFHQTNLNPNSYNFHLAGSLLVLSRRGKLLRRVSIPPEGYVLEPGRVYLGTTLERIGSNRFVTLLLGRSSVGRLGIFLNITADLGHLGSCSNWTLEMTVVHRVRIYKEMKIGQISFWLTDKTSVHYYHGRYHLDSQPVANRDPTLAGGMQ